MKIGNDWDELLKQEFEKEYYRELTAFIKKERESCNVFPAEEDVFNALKLTPYSEVKAVIFGQDPYHEINQAHGLAFSVKNGVKLPPSLKNVFKELNSDLGVEIPKSGDLTSWGLNGVLLLNAVLTVREGQANSHAGKGWEVFTDAITKLLNERENNQDKPVAFILWGKNAEKKIPLLTNPERLILTSAHPSPLSAYAGFFGNKHFSKTNEFLKSKSLPEIDWSL